MKVIADRPPPGMYKSGLEIDCQCARCGSSCYYNRGGWQVCCSGAEWCETNPLPGREYIKRGQIEWFTFEEPK